MSSISSQTRDVHILLWHVLASVIVAWTVCVQKEKEEFELTWKCSWQVENEGYHPDVGKECVQVLECWKGMVHPGKTEHEFWWKGEAMGGRQRGNEPGKMHQSWAGCTKGGHFCFDLSYRIPVPLLTQAPSPPSACTSVFCSMVGCMPGHLTRCSLAPSSLEVCRVGKASIHTRDCWGAL